MAVAERVEVEPSIADLLAARPALAMHAQDGLCFEGIPLNAIADEFGTPTWVYGAATMRARFKALADSFTAVGLHPHIHYAVKANDHLAVLSVLRAAGAGADVVSLGEFLRAQKAGVPARDIVFSGVGKSQAELTATLTAGIGQINVESAEELTILSGIAASLGKTANIVLRMNPDVDAGTHAKITTGLADNKFGIAAQEIVSLYSHAASLPGINPVGIALHIGSQITSPAPYATAYAKAANMVRALRDAGQTVSTLDLGGGIGIGYYDEPGMPLAAFATMVRNSVGDLGVNLLLEPGRYLVAPAGMLLASVILQKQSGKRFVVLDAAMNDLLRPALYESYHGILPISPVDFQHPASPADVVGPVCETGDTFATDRPLPNLAPGARVALLDAGAYGAVMSSPYNARPRAAAVLLDGGQAHLISPRQTHQDLWAHEIIPG
ncbi:MAG: diaminopimelate decarboxylase [Acidocella sp. 20-57-95]|nr:MAG: diaminopimelate decarboxylase [Acidocella sp. 20-57-95]OYV62202.1 MAG: diaminopimelate decarboxylase [Acidocella sp. 21-58-7]HQT63764.1 diaminopimelate decarboxylase [Acidocella sp.]HQU03141.1 diaminopimelate decarboxylase [Acidocella sp.]